MEDSFLFSDIFYIIVFVSIGFAFLLVQGLILFVIIKKLKDKAYNDRQPILNVEAKVISKRLYVSGFDHAHTSYYATFEVGNGDRLEFAVGNIYAFIVENDTGILKYQGNRFLGFTRDRSI